LPFIGNAFIYLNNRVECYKIKRFVSNLRFEAILKFLKIFFGKNFHKCYYLRERDKIWGELDPKEAL